MMATNRLTILFDNQIATLTDVIDDDKAEVRKLGKVSSCSEHCPLPSMLSTFTKQDPVFKEWTSNQYGNMTHAHDVITVVTEPIYIVC